MPVRNGAGSTCSRPTRLQSTRRTARCAAITFTRKPCKVPSVVWYAGRDLPNGPRRTPFMGKKGEGHTEDVHIFRLEKPGFRIYLVGSALQSSPYHLLAQQLGGECPQPHDVGDGLGIPALGKHTHGNDMPDLLPGLIDLPHGVHGAAQQLRLFGLGQLTLSLRCTGSWLPSASSFSLDVSVCATSSSRASACSSTLESMCKIRSGS